MHEIAQQKGSVFLKFLSFFAFYIFIFAAFFGTNLPFQDRPEEIYDLTSSNPVNQLIYSILFIISFFTLIFERNRIYRIFKAEKWLFFLIIWCILSIAWSNYPFVTFKRLFQYLTSILVSLSAILYAKSNQEIKQCIFIILGLYITLSIVAVLVEPGAIDPSTMTWRGFAKSKNLLGQTALISIIFWSHYIFLKTKKHIIPGSIFLLLSTILLIGSNSMTSIISLIFVILVAFQLHLDAHLLRSLRIGHTFTLFIFLLFILAVLIIYVVDFETLVHFPELFGKDISFTGRTDLWKDIYNISNHNLLLGCGFRAFWVLSNPSLLYIYRTYIWLPNQSHLGYLDIFNEIGLVGISLFAGLCIYYFKNISRSVNSGFWKWFFIIGLVINLQETTFFSPKHVSSVMFFLSYLVLANDLIQNQNTRTIRQ